MIEHQAAWRPRGEIGRWIVAQPAVARIGTSLFVHGGLSPAYATVPIDEINRRVAAALVARETGPDVDHQRSSSGPYGIAVWPACAPNAMPAAPPATPTAPFPSIDQQLDQLLAATGAKRIVIGHTPLMSGVAVTNRWAAGADR